MSKPKCFTAILPDTPEARRLLAADSREGRDRKLGSLAKVHDDDAGDPACADFIASNPNALAVVTIPTAGGATDEAALGEKFRETYEARKSAPAAATPAPSSSKKKK